MDVRLSSSSPISDVSFVKSGFSFLFLSMFVRYDPIARHDFVTNILDPIYGPSGHANMDSIHSHRLSVFFILLASGIKFDTLPSAALLAEQYYSLARAALSLDPIGQEVTCATVQAIFMMIRFIYDSDRASSETRWLLTGLCTRVAQTVCCFSTFFFCCLMT
jgi:hypothetical protein